MSTEPRDELISVREAARLCGRNAETIRRWVWSGKLPAEKLGNQLFIKRSALDSYCRETAVLQYKAEPEVDFLERTKPLRQQMKARGVEPINTAEVIRQISEEQMNQIEQSMQGNGIKEYSARTENNLLENVREVRKRILTRTETLFDATEDLRKIREERRDELLHLR